MYFNTNIKFLRKHRGRTQDDIAFALQMKRSTLSGYENGVSEPNLEALVAFSKYFGIAIDTLVKVDLSSISPLQLSQLERGYDVHLKGSNLRVLATTVNADNNENIELVNEKAKAGYATGFADPEYIKVLPTFTMPFLSHDRKYRTFQISGDSMLHRPHPGRRHRLQDRRQQDRARRQAHPQLAQPTLPSLRPARRRHQGGVEICALHQRGNATTTREPLPRRRAAADRATTEETSGRDTVMLEYLISISYLRLIYLKSAQFLWDLGVM